MCGTWRSTEGAKINTSGLYSLDFALLVRNTMAVISGNNLFNNSKG